MKTNKHITAYLLLIMISVLGLSCEDILEEPVKSEFTESTLLAKKSGLESVLADAYGKIISSRNMVKRGEMTSDILWQRGGGEEGTATPLINFNWDPSNTLEAFDWMTLWQAIRDANIVLANAPDATGFNTDTERSQLIAEARFMRVWAYYVLWDQYGSMPVRQSVDDPDVLPRVSEDEFRSFIETEFKAILEDIYPEGGEPAYGRVNRGGVRGLLCLWYLNTHQWQKCVDAANEIIASGKYKLCDDYNAMFAIENERNTEFILIFSHLANSGACNYTLATAWPTDIQMGLDGYIDGVINTQWSSFASNYRMYRSYYDSFNEKDQRKGRILTKYVNKSGQTIDLLENNTTNDKGNIRGIKYPPDPDANADQHGNDFPYVRYAEILLAKAEAINELSGPNQDVLDLINAIRNRAGLESFSLSDFSGDKEKALNQILNERWWEFWYEGKRRRDLIRRGRFITDAQKRGIKNAQPFHVYFPIPQSAIDANPLLEQNDGY
ncbi:MAG: RagB/SusD family nutrient uptake outer membrane protein [Tannerellaceae bacterium]|nr:RagB/SusD family nutrient uptake outer membrane protein [Tannerellaceae bacterium]